MNITFAYNIWFFILIAIVIIAFAIWIYRDTLPKVSQTYRKILLFFRTASLVLLLALLFEPFLQLLLSEKINPHIAVLLDSSASMQIKNGNTSRRAVAMQALQALQQTNFTEKPEIQLYTFSDSLTAIQNSDIDTSLFSDDGTDLAQALTTLQRNTANQNFQAVFLISDGAHNLGADPVHAAEQMAFPVYAIKLGEQDERRDALIQNVNYNLVAYAGNEIPIEVSVLAEELADQPTQLVLRSDGEVVARQPLTLPRNALEKRITLFTTPETEGDKKYEVELIPVEGEITASNNRQVFYIDVKKNKIRLHLVAGRLSPDTKFLLQSIERNQNFSVNSTIALNSQRTIGTKLPDSFNDIDCIIAVNPVSSDADPTLLHWLKKGVDEFRKPIFLISGAIDQTRQLTALGEILKVRPNLLSNRIETRRTTVTGSGLTHPIFQVDENTTIEEIFEALPPVFVTRIREIQNPAVIDLAVTVENQQAGNPRHTTAFISVSKLGQRRALAIWGEGIWRWHMMMQADASYGGFYDAFVNNAIRWLASDEDSRLLKVKTNKRVYRAGEVVIFQAQAYQEDYSAYENLDISVTIKNAKKPAFQLKESHPGFYENNALFLEAGDFAFQAIAKNGEQVVAQDSGKFTIAPYQFEFQQADLNNRLLSQISSISGGTLISADSIAAVFDRVKFQAVERFEQKEYKTWQHWLVMWVIVSSLAVEWFLRKKKGML